MPHSSGGGSHSSGSHSSSFHSSGSHSSRGSSTIQTSYIAAANKYPGAKRYIYFENNMPVFVWADYDVTKDHRSRGRIVKLIVALIFWVLSVLHSIHNPSELEWTEKELEAAGSNTYLINDKADIFKDTSGLAQALEEFYQLTKIRPAIITVEEQSWINNYDSMEVFAYDMYVNIFDDEKHWLLIYSVPPLTDDNFENWKWEGMQGDYTDPILTTDETSAFNKNLHKMLLDRNSYSVEEAFEQAFRDLNKTVMSIYIPLEAIISDIVTLVIILLFFFFAGGGFHPVREKIYRTATLCPENFKDYDNCEYCGTKYLIGFHKKCPSCGAPLKAHDYTTDAQGNITAIIN